MKYLAFAADYDGTLAIHGSIRPELIDALTQLRDSGRKLILVTGREMADLKRCCPQYTLFDRIVLENGALLYQPRSEELRLLTHRPSELFIRLLRQRHVHPLSVGHCIVATQIQHEDTVAQCIAELSGLNEPSPNYSVILNKGSVMILPMGVNKGSGLKTALEDLKILASQTVGMGDAENDIDLLKACGRSYAVADSTPGLIAIAQHTTRGGAHHGPLEVIRDLLLG